MAKPSSALAVIAAFLAALAVPAAQACERETDAPPLRMLAGDHGGWQVLGRAMAACPGVETRLEPDARAALGAALSGDPAAIHIAGVGSDTLPVLYAAEVLRPLDALVAQHGAALADNQLVSVDGRVMAIAALVNTQHLFYRADIFADLGLEPPATWADAFAAAEAIRRAGVVAHPMGAAMGGGWDLAQDFINMHLGYGGSVLDAQNQPTVLGDPGFRALAMMQAITPYLPPDHLQATPADVRRALQEGEIAMAVLWSTEAAAMDDPERSRVVGQVAGAPAPRATPGGPPTATLWWEGIAIARAIPDGEAEAAFRVAMEALSPATAQAHGAAAIWLIPGYRPGRLASGAMTTATADPAPSFYPGSEAMVLMHGALAAELPAYFRGDRDAEDTLTAVEAAYRHAADAAGLLAPPEQAEVPEAPAPAPAVPAAPAPSD